MNLHTRYIISTSAYAVCVVIGIIAAIYFSTVRQWWLVAISVLFALVALDNVFCGDHCRTAGFNVPGHWVIPPFLKGK